MKDLFCKPFVFNSTRYEVWQDQRCTKQANTNIKIIAIPSGCYMSFRLIGNFNLDIEYGFKMGMDTAARLEDRIQYGLLGPTNSRTTPIVCNLFNNMSCIRFALASPLRLIEFYGSYEETSITEIEKDADRFVTAFIRKQETSEMGIQLLRKIKYDPKQLETINNPQVICHAMLAISFSNIIDDEDTKDLSAMIGYWCISKAIENEPTNLNLYIDRILTMKHCFEGMKSIAASCFVRETNPFSFFSGSNMPDFEANDAIYLMQAADIYKHPQIWENVTAIKNDIDTRFSHNIFSQISSRDDIIAKGEEYHERLMSDINKRICEDNDLNI